MAEPPADYQLHNSLFLVAHFHTMIVSGVLFGYFAGLTYWFPKIFGFKLNEKIGKQAFWFWLFGFILAFGPLYMLGLMGATRRLDHYDPSMGWQGLFIVAGIGAVLIAIGLVLQIVQIVVSIMQRKNNLDTTGDPWDGHTLEWSIPSPAPAYNFAVLPEVSERDDYWHHKHHNRKLPPLPYEDIHMPKNTSAAIFIALFILLFGFGVVWHIWWLVLVAFVGGVVAVLDRTFNENTEYILKAAEVAEMDIALRKHS